MASNPLFAGPDGTLRAQWNFTTTRSSRFFTGTLDPSTAYVEVSVYGGAFTQDPNLVTFEGTSFTLPNPTAYPQGLRLLPGLNAIRVRSILTSGAVTDVAIANATVVQAEGQAGVYPPPSGVSVERLDGAIQVIVRSDLLDSNLIGHNFYASPQPGGGTVGYFQINPTLRGVDDAAYLQAVNELGTFQSDVAVYTDPNNVTPDLSYRFRGDQVYTNTPDTTLAAAFDELIDISQYDDVIGPVVLRSQITLSAVTRQYLFTFIHDRYGDTFSKYPTLPNGELASVLQTNPLYYAVTAVYFDPLTSLEVETALSVEVSGIPLQVTPSIGTFPIATRQEVTQDLISSIYRSNPDVAVQPGSVLRDTFIDPMASESERLRYIMDFVHRAQSFATLLAVDDPNLTGVSVPVRQSAYKLALAQAFRITNLTQVQDMIDMAFDKLASNAGKPRETGTAASGEVTFYLTSVPSQTINLPIGTIVSGGGVSFATTSSVSFDPNNLAPYYNPNTGQYAAKAFIQCNTVGPNGNVPARGITSVSVSNVRVVNDADTFGGLATESNYSLATRVIRAIASVDTSTYQGTVSTVGGIAGVLEAEVISAGDPYMLRDVDPATGRHVGGKVDVWVRGTQTSPASDTFAFSYENLFGVTFEVVGAVTDLTLRAVLLNPDGTSILSASTPLTQMLSYPSASPARGLHNLTRGYDFNLTDLQYLSFDTIRLSAQYNDPTDLSVADVLTGDFRLRTSFAYPMRQQPVSLITGVRGTSGTVSPTQYALFKLESPFLLGQSALASDYIQFSTPSPTGALGSVLTTTGETHVLIGSFVENLNRFGINPITIEVWNSSRTVQYAAVSPSESAPDFRILAPAEPMTQAWAIQRTEASAIPSGATVLVDYLYDENFTVTYTSNTVARVAQNQIEKKRSLTADILVKQANPLLVDIDATVVLQQDQRSDVVDPNIRAALINLLLNTPMGSGVRQGDVISAIDAVNGVSYPVVPLTKMTVADDTHILGEALVTSQDGDALSIAAWATGTVQVWLVQDPLTYSTVDGGGTENTYRAVTQDAVALTLLVAPPNLAGQPLNTAIGQALIIGATGLSIPGYSDDATLVPTVTGYPRWLQLGAAISAGTASLAETAEHLRLTADIQTNVQASRVALTADRILVTTALTDSPLSHSYAVTYFVSGDTGSKDIEATNFDYVTVGTINLTYDSDRQTNRRTFLTGGSGTV